MRPGRRRAVATVALAVVVAGGLIVSRGLPDSVATDIAGDALYAAAVFTGLVVLWPRARRAVLALLAAAWCVAVEVLQATGLPSALAERFPPIALVLGTGFDPRDLVVYVLAVAAAMSLDAAVSARLLPRGGAAVGVGGPE